MNILFICKHNRFRSKVAEAFFLKYNNQENQRFSGPRKLKSFRGNKKHHVKSRGMLRDIDVAKNVVKVLRERGVNLRNKKSIGMTKNDERWASLIVVVANNVDVGFEKKTITWKIRDTNQGNIKEIRRIVTEIEKKVIDLVRKLK